MTKDNRPIFVQKRIKRKMLSKVKIIKFGFRKNQESNKILEHGHLWQKDKNKKLQRIALKVFQSKIIENCHYIKIQNSLFQVLIFKSKNNPLLTNWPLFKEWKLEN